MVEISVVFDGQIVTSWSVTMRQICTQEINRVLGDIEFSLGFCFISNQFADEFEYECLDRFLMSFRLCFQLLKIMIRNLQYQLCHDVPPF